MCDRSRPNARFVRESGAFEALDQGTDHTASNTQTGKCTFKDLAKGPADLVCVHQDDHQRGDHVHHAHEGHDLFRHLGDGFQAADDHGKHDSGKDHACDPARVIADHIGDLCMGLVGLEHVAAAEGAEDTEDREHHRQDLAAGNAAFGKALGQVVHRTTRNGAVLVFIPVFHAQRTFGEFRRHAQQTSQNQPECRARPADAHGHRHTCDVAKAHRARKRSGKRLEMANLTRVIGI